MGSEKSRTQTGVGAEVTVDSFGMEVGFSVGDGAIVEVGVGALTKDVR